MALKLIMTRGLPASGKSTWAKQYIKDNPTFKRINRDDLRAMFDNGKWTPENEKFVVRIQEMLITEAFNNFYSVIIDDVNLNPKNEQRLRLMIIKHNEEQAYLTGTKDYHIDFEIKDFTEVPLEECLRRDKQRMFNSVGDKVILKFWNDYLKPPLLPFHTTLPTIILCDVDGTLAEKGDRSQYDETKVLYDKPIKPVIDILRTYKNDGRYKIFLVSGRHDTCMGDTKKWLDMHQIPYDKLFMRPANNNDKDFTIKRQIYEQNIKDKYNVLFVLDDRDQVVTLWRSLGLKCLQVDYGFF